MQFRGGMSELLRQAERYRRKIDDRKAELKDQEVSGKAAGENVRVTATCEGKVRRIDVEPAFLEAEGLEMVLDTIVVAVNAALEQADSTVEAEITKITGGMKIPGL